MENKGYGHLLDACAKPSQMLITAALCHLFMIINSKKMPHCHISLLEANNTCWLSLLSYEGRAEFAQHAQCPGCCVQS